MNVRAYWRPSEPRGVHRQPRAMILVVVLVVVALVSPPPFPTDVRGGEATELAGRRIQARALVNSGIDYVRLLLAQDEILLLVWASPTIAATFRALVVDDTDEETGRFTVVAPNLKTAISPGFIRPEDESTKLNLNYLAQKDSEDTSATR